MNLYLKALESFMSCIVLSVIDIPGNGLSQTTIVRQPEPRISVPAEETLSGPCRIVRIENRAAGSLYECQIYTSPLGN